ncbi:hypothetical protein [Staphylococcus chromogenes]|uniref:hypothetical protein n=1 Tax=Staphylococcus chromogenes TaxID=46126 RepID=UPI0021CFF584|nr:hypothetical protein [Staphylococcus chromogenes]UXS75593.1 hypothetical protein MUA20_00365 [Staphylococcus chromogenes]
MGNQFTPIAHAEQVTQIEPPTSLEAYIQKSQADIQKLKTLSAQQKAQLNTDIHQAQSIDEIDRLLKEAHVDLLSTEEGNQASSLRQSPSEMNQKLEELRSNHEQINQNIDRFFTEVDSSTHKVDGGKLSDVNLNDDATLSARHLAETLNQKEPDISNLKKDLHQLLSVSDENQGALDHYVATKEEGLKAFESKLATEPNLSEERKALLNKEIQSIQRELNEQNDVVRQRLNTADNKPEAVRALIGETLNDKEAANVLKRIQTDGKSNAQIANQIVSQLDRFTTLTSDDLLRSMLENTTQRKDLIETLLSTRFDSTEASKIADDILKGNPTNAQILERLKQLYGPDMTADDILENVFDQAHNQRQALETILKSKFSPDVAHALAERLENKANARGELLQLLKSDADTHLNQLIKANNDIQRLKSKIHGMFNPLDRMQDLFNPSHSRLLEGGLLRGQSTLFNPLGILDQLLNGKSLLDNIPDLPNPTQGRALSLLKPTDSFLSGLFDHNGNFDLPAAGQIAKQRLLPLGILMIVIGGFLLWGLKRRHSHKSS